MSEMELHHVGIVVEDIEDALRFYRDALGLSVREVRDLSNERVRIAFLPLGNTLLELVQPLETNSGVARYLAARGRASALHHVCFAVEDLAAQLDRLAGEGLELVDREPRPGAEGQVAFLHPNAAAGVLVELVDRASLERP